jgi:malate/lactate dehydrogenase
MQDYYGVSDICLSVPSVVNREGINTTLKLPLDRSELASFRNSAATLKKIADTLKL